MWVRWLSRLSPVLPAILWLLLARIKALGGPSGSGNIVLQRGVRSRGLSLNGKVVTAYAVLAIGLGEPLLQHTVIVPHDGGKLRMEVK